MNEINLTTLTMEQLYSIVGGMKNPTNDFVVSKDVSRLAEFINNPFRASASVIVICTGGSFSVNVNMNVYHLKKGSILLYGEGSILEYYDVSEDATFSLMMFSRKLIEDTMIDLKSVIPIFKYIMDNTDELLVLDENEQGILRKFWELLYEIVGYGKMLILKDIFAGFLRTLGEMYNKRLSDRQYTKTRQEDYFERFIKLVTVHHHNERSVKFYADSLHITPKYLSTIIKEISGKSAASWINDFVIQQSKIMLRFSGKSIQEITYELNFSTQSFFGKYFKRHTGMSPSEYRQSE